MSNEYEPSFEPNKFRELILHAAERSEGDNYFGMVKLSKILFFSDFLAFGITGEAITGATYVKQPRGPMPAQLKSTIRGMEQNAEAHIVSRKIFNYEQKRLIPYRSANINIFSGEEMDLIESVIRHLSDKTAAEVSDFSHERSFAWEIAEIGETIPYTAVFLSGRKPTSIDIERGKELARKYGWLDAAK